MAMLEPVLPLLFEARLGLGPAADRNAVRRGGARLEPVHPIYGRLSDRWGGRRLMLVGLVPFRA